MMGVRAKQTLAMVGALVVAGVMLALGLWQMASYERSTRDVSAERAARPPVPLADAVAADGSVDDIYGRRVAASGRYVPEHQVLVGSSGPLRVVTAFRLDDGRHVAVVRGAVDDATAAVPPPPSGAVDLSGVFLAADRADAESPAAGAALATLRLQALAQQWPFPLIGGYVTVPAEESEDAGMAAAEHVLPAAEGSPTHRGYALQWWVFAAGSVAIGVYSVRQIGRETRRGAGLRRLS